MTGDQRGRSDIGESRGPVEEAGEVLIAPEDEDVDRADTEADLVGRGVPDDVDASAEEVAVHVRDDAPGGNDDDDPGYVRD